MFVVVDAMFSRLMVDGKATECVEGTIGRPWAIIVIDEA
jgi:hypothetical protein